MSMRYGFVVSPTQRTDADDALLYDEVAADAAFGRSLGFESAWFIEHHFSDYFPIPSPLLFMANVAARCPDLSLGTCVTVTPWYHPMRFAEEVAMLSHMTKADLFIGMGRGSAPMEYEAYGVDQNKSKEIFAEHWEIIRRGMSGEKFSFDGEFTQVGREVNIRPRPKREKVHFYGAISSPPTAKLMGQYGLAPLCSSSYPMKLQTQMLTEWRDAMTAAGGEVEAPATVMAHVFIADTDEEAQSLCRQYGPLHFQQQITHYEIGKFNYDGVKGYENFNRMMDSFNRFADPAQIDPWMKLQIVGSPETCRRMIAEYEAAGMGKILVHMATAGIPRSLRREMLDRFARECVPDLSRMNRVAAE